MRKQLRNQQRLRGIKIRYDEGKEVKPEEIRFWQRFQPETFPKDLK